MRDNLINNIKKYQLFDSNYIICEKLHCIVRNNTTLKDKTIVELADWSDKYIADVFSKNEKEIGTIKAINFGSIDVINLNYMAKHLNGKGVTFKTHNLPQPDQTDQKGGYIWYVYSDEQKINLVKKFFYWREVSYMEMINSNFPKMVNYFKLAKDFPNKYKIRLVFREHNEEMFSQPTIQYYHISAQNSTEIEPEIAIGESNAIQHDAVFAEIQDSYLKNNKEPNKIEFSSTLFDMVLLERRTGDKLPLTSCVYKDFENDVKELFGKN